MEIVMSADGVGAARMVENRESRLARMMRRGELRCMVDE